MATNYWYNDNTADWDGSVSSSSFTGSSGTGGVTRWVSIGGTATGTSNYIRVITRTILVKHPKNWTDKQGLLYVELVNKRIRTNWKVTMLIKGDILITDPNVEKRKMKEFILLLKDDISVEDVKIVNEFLKENPLK